MKKKICLLLSFIMAVTLMFGMSVTAFADEPSIEACTHDGQESIYIITGEISSAPTKVAYKVYNKDGTYSSSGSLAKSVFDDGNPIIGGRYHKMAGQYKFALCEVIPPYDEIGHVTVNVDIDSAFPGKTVSDILTVTGDGIDFASSEMYIFDTEDESTPSTEIVAGKEYFIAMKLEIADGRNVGSGVFTDYECNIGVETATLYGEDGNEPSSDDTDYIVIMTESFPAVNLPTPDPDPNLAPTPGHTHNFEWQIISEPSLGADGLEAEVCTICGARRNEQTVSAYGYTLYSYGLHKLNGAQKGQTVVLDFGEWNSFPKKFMEKVKEKVDAGVTVTFKYKYQHVPYEITIPAYSKVYTNLEWCGPACMYQLYVLGIPVENQ